MTANVFDLATSNTHLWAYYNTHTSSEVIGVLSGWAFCCCCCWLWSNRQAEWNNTKCMLKDGAVGGEKSSSICLLWRGGVRKQRWQGEIETSNKEGRRNGGSHRLHAEATVEEGQGGLETISWNCSIHTSTQDKTRLTSLGTFSFIHLMCSYSSCLSEMVPGSF